jgi:translation initiation factor 1A
MVKNYGGNKSKGQARKHVTKPSSSLRISENEFELYGQVTKVLGGGMCNVFCIDKVYRLCHIRGKFKTRGKRDNFLTNSTWVLIGLRDWASFDKDKLEQCDLLEVYSDFEKDKLKNTVLKIDWSVFNALTVNDGRFTTEKEDDSIIFTDSVQDEYHNIVAKQILTNSSSFFENEEEDITIDDI